MDAVIAIPAGSLAARLMFRKACGVPLLFRAIANVTRAGLERVIIVTDSVGIHSAILHHSNHAITRQSRVEVWRIKETDGPIEEPPSLPRQFLWYPLTRLTDTAYIRAVCSGTSAAPATIPCAKDLQRVKVASASEFAALWESQAPNSPAEPISAEPATAGVSLPILSAASIPALERELVRRSGKPGDGIYSKANRWLCRPIVRWLCNLPVTPNMVTLVGVLAAILAGIAFAQGTWPGSIIGALLYFVCVLFDEMDGMLARLTFQDSPLGCWLETVADYTSYISLFVGMTIGLYRQSGPFWLWSGILLLAGTIITMLVLSRQRKETSVGGDPSHFRKRVHRALEADQANPVSRFTRTLEFMVRKPAYCYFVLVFSLLHAVKPLLFLTAVGANVAWMVALHFDHLLRPAHNISGMAQEVTQR